MDSIKHHMIKHDNIRERERYIYIYSIYDYIFIGFFMPTCILCVYKCIPVVPHKAVAEVSE